MKVLCLIAVLLAVVTSSAGVPSGRRYRVRDYDYRYDYRYDGWGRPYYPMERPVEESSEEKEEVDDRVYTFHIHEADHGAYLYHDEEGHAVGFEIDLLHEVCEHAGKECYFVLDKGDRCWTNEGLHEYPGIGLLAGWYDGCLGFFPTAERKNSFTFTKAFTENMKVGLYYKKDAGLMNAEDDHELANHTIGFVENWPLNQICLDHQQDYHGNHVGEYSPMLYPDVRTMVKAVMKGEVDAVLLPRVVGEFAINKKGLGLTHTEPYFECTTDGAGVMTRYGSDVPLWWNKAFNEMVDSGDFRRLCMKGSKVHGSQGKIYCA